VISSSEDDEALERQEIDQMLAQRVDALVVASVQRAPDAFRRVEAQKTPLVLIDRQLPQVRAPFVGVDDVEVGFLATDHLVQIGCRRIGHIGGPDLSVGRGRLAGYRKALAKHRLPEPPGAVVTARATGIHTQASGVEAMRALLALRPRLDGVFCFNDPLAIGALEAAGDAGVRVPEDIAIVGAANLFYDNLLRVPLTSVDQNAAAIGERAAALALDLVAGKRPARTPVVLLPPTLVPRASTARPGR
jgi:LacI family transcriptional regulator